jgi:hypothetical protein
MRRNKTYTTAGTHVRARDEQERDAKIAACQCRVTEGLLDSDLFGRLPVQQVMPNRASFDLLLHNYFGAVGFSPEEKRAAPLGEVQFVKYGGLNGVEVGIITVRDLVYLAARPLRDPIDGPSEKALVWLEKVMETAKQAAQLLFEKNELSSDRDMRTVLAYRAPGGDLHVEEFSRTAFLDQQSKMAGVDYQIMRRDEFGEWMQRTDKNPELAFDISDKEWAVGEMLIETKAEEIAVMYDGAEYRFADADAIGTPSESEYIAKFWQQKFKGLVISGAEELVEARERLPEWLTPEEREKVIERVNRCLLPMFYARLQPELSVLTERFSEVDSIELYQTIFREVDDGKMRFQLDKKTGRVMIDPDDALERLATVFEVQRGSRQAIAFRSEAFSSEAQGRRRGISV